MERLIFCLFALVFFAHAEAQINTDEFSNIKMLEDSLLLYGDQMHNEMKEADRIAACQKFIPLLVEALKTPNSFEYNFDTLDMIKVINAPDNSFRIFTWQIQYNNTEHQFFGTIQVNNKDELELYPLLDRKKDIPKPLTAKLTTENWYGAIYYDIHQYKYQGVEYYLLFGWDGHDGGSNIKLVDVMYFKEGKGLPQFGESIFVQRNRAYKRFMFEYAEDGNATIKYDPDLKMIVYNHLIPLDPEIDGPENLVPDGSYEGFAFKKGKWHHKKKLFEFKLLDGQAPIWKPVLGVKEEK